VDIIIFITWISPSSFLGGATWVKKLEKTTNILVEKVVPTPLIHLLMQMVFHVIMLNSS
jgi:hypothetical protein